MYQSRDPEAYDICPYNSAHYVIRSRMSTHIVKCRKAHQGESPMTICLFNANHSIPETEARYHLENCPDRFNLDKHVIVSKDVDLTRFPIEHVDIENEENWDEENCQSYKPDDYCEKNFVLRQKKVESASVRKNFRNEERQRMQKLKDMGPSDTSGEPFRSSESSSQNKFRSTSLANTITNISENYSYDDIQRMNASTSKAITTDPNCKPNFVRSSETKKQTFESNSTPNTEAGDDDEEGAVGFSSMHASDSVDRQDDQGFIIPKSKKKIGRGRGRGVTH